MLMRSVWVEMSSAVTDDGSEKSDPLYAAKLVDLALYRLWQPWVILPMDALTESVHDADHSVEGNAHKHLVLGKRRQPPGPKVEKRKADVTYALTASLTTCRAL